MNEALDNRSFKKRDLLETPREHQIIACVGPKEHFTEGLRWLEKFELDTKHLFAEATDWNAPPSILDRRQQLHNKTASPEKGIYVMSHINSNNKISTGYQDCTGVAVAGVGAGGKKVSFLTHQAPSVFLSSKQQNLFLDAFRQRLGEMRTLCDERTLSAVIFGGSVDTGDSTLLQKFTSVYYNRAVETLTWEIGNELGIVGNVVESPNESSFEGTETLDVFLENDTRRLHVMRIPVSLKE